MRRVDCRSCSHLLCDLPRTCVLRAARRGGVATGEHPPPHHCPAFVVRTTHRPASRAGVALLWRTCSGLRLGGRDAWRAPTPRMHAHRDRVVVAPASVPWPVRLQAALVRSVG